MRALDVGLLLGGLGAVAGGAYYVLHRREAPGPDDGPAPAGGGGGGGGGGLVDLAKGLHAAGCTAILTAKGVPSAGALCKLNTDATVWLARKQLAVVKGAGKLALKGTKAAGKGAVKGTKAAGKAVAKGVKSLFGDLADAPADLNAYALAGAAPARGRTKRRSYPSKRFLRPAPCACRGCGARSPAGADFYERLFAS